MGPFFTKTTNPAAVFHFAPVPIYSSHSFLSSPSIIIIIIITVVIIIITGSMQNQIKKTSAKAACGARVKALPNPFS